MILWIVFSGSQTKKDGATVTKGVSDIKTLIAIPCLDMVPVGFMASMINLRKGPDVSYTYQPNSMIYDSRNNMAARALQSGQYDRMLWIDSDMMFDPDLLERLSMDMDEYHLDYVTALAFKRHIPTGPCIYKDIIYQVENDILHSEAVTYKDYPENSLFEIKASGFGAVLVKCDLIKEVWNQFGPPFDPMPQIGEDLSFCWRVLQLGKKMWCDSSVRVGHVGQYVYSEEDYKRSGGDEN